MENLNLFIRSIFVDNMIFAYFLGMCSFLAVSKNVKTAFGLGVAVSFVLIIALPVTWCINQYILVPGALSWLGEEYAETDLSFLGLIMFISVIAALVQILSRAVFFTWHIFAAHSCELCNSWRSALHAAA